MAKKVYDCHVTGICSGKNADFVRRMGADEVVDYTSVDVAETLLEKVREERVFDLYIDCVGGVEVFNHWVKSVQCMFVLFANSYRPLYCTREVHMLLSLGTKQQDHPSVVL